MGLFGFFKKNTTKNDQPIDRRSIPAETIDEMQKVDAGEQYRNLLYKMFFRKFPEMPFISLDRERNTNWIEQVKMFPNTLISPDMMRRFSDGLLPGHVYLIHWFGKRNGKRIPAYFEYEYGINAHKEKEFLRENGYLDSEYNPTQKGLDCVKEHYDVITEKEPQKTVIPLDMGRPKNDVALNSGPWEDRYFTNMKTIQDLWSKTSQTKDYTGDNAATLENLCTQNIAEYKKMIKTAKWKDSPPKNIPAFKRLAMLYEKQDRYEAAYQVVQDSLKFGMESERSRLDRLMKKLN